jgi:phage tail sheath gpL-like
MPIITGISPTLRRPQTFHKFTYLIGGRGLTPLPQRACLMGTQKGGTAIASQVYEITDAEQADGLFGKGTELALMIRKAFETGAAIGTFPVLSAVGVIEPGAGVARIQTLTVTGPATATDTIELRIAGRYINVGVAAGDAANNIASAIRNEIFRYSDVLPISSSVATSVVTCTANYKGVNGNDIVFEVVKVPAGVAITSANPTPGAGVADYAPAFAAVLGVDFDCIGIGNHAAADVAAALSHVTACWTATSKLWRWIVIGESGTIGTSTALAAAANDRAIIVANCEGTPSLPSELAAAMAIAVCGKTRPNANYAKMPLPLYPPSTVLAFTPQEVETCLASGVTPLSPISDPNTRVTKLGVIMIERLVTSFTNISGQPSEVLRDLAVSRVGAYVARQLDAKYQEQFGPLANPDGVLLTDDTIQQIRDLVSNVLYACQDVFILKGVDADVKLMVVEADVSAPGRVNVDMTYHIVFPLYQIAFVHRVTL